MMASTLVAETLQGVIARHLPRLGENSGRFLGRIYGTDLSVYGRRLEAVGFSGRERVLDAGCGFGQWTLALAGMNGAVVGLDIFQDRVDFVRDAAAALGLANVRVEQGSIEALPFPDRDFDAVYCYGTIFLTRWRQSLAELCRVLKPGGTIYLNANGIGWYKHLWINEPNKASDYDPRERTAKVFLNTWRYARGEDVEPGMDILISPEDLEEALRGYGCPNIRIGGEGRLRVPGFSGEEPRAFFQETYLGDVGVYEALAEKAAC